MSELNNNPLIIIVALGAIALLAAQTGMRWWRERQYDLSGKTVLIKEPHSKTTRFSNTNSQVYAN